MQLTQTIRAHGPRENSSNGQRVLGNKLKKIVALHFKYQGVYIMQICAIFIQAYIYEALRKPQRQRP